MRTAVAQVCGGADVRSGVKGKGKMCDAWSKNHKVVVPDGQFQLDTQYCLHVYMHHTSRMIAKGPLSCLLSGKMASDPPRASQLLLP